MKLLRFLDKALKVPEHILERIPYFNGRLCCGEILIDRDAESFSIVIKCINNPKYVQVIYEQYSLARWEWFIEEIKFYGLSLPSEYLKRQVPYSFVMGESTLYEHKVGDMLVNIVKKETSIINRFTSQRNVVLPAQYITSINTFFTPFGIEQKLTIPIEKGKTRMNSIVVLLLLAEELTITWNQQSKISDIVERIDLSLGDKILTSKPGIYFDILDKLRMPIDREIEREVTRRSSILSLELELLPEGLLNFAYGNEEPLSLVITLAKKTDPLSTAVKLKINYEFISDELADNILAQYFIGAYYTNFIYWTEEVVYNFNRAERNGLSQYINIYSQSDIKATLIGFLLVVEDEDKLQIHIDGITIFNDENTFYKHSGLQTKVKMRLSGLNVYDNSIYFDLIDNFPYCDKIMVEINIISRYLNPKTIKIVWILANLYRYEKNKEKNILTKSFV